MNNISSGAVSSEKKTGEVRIGSEPFFLRRRGKPLESLPGVGVGGGEEVFGSTAVVDGEDEDGGGGGEGGEVGVVGGGGGGFDAETATVEVEEDGERVGLRMRREEETDGDGRGGGREEEEKVFGKDTGGRVEAGRDRGGAGETLDSAAFVCSEAWVEVGEDLIGVD